ncbi:MAG: hypothetical protein ACJAT5_000255 [Lentimonas sp.]
MTMKPKTCSNTCADQCLAFKPVQHQCTAISAVRFLVVQLCVHVFCRIRAGLSCPSSGTPPALSSWFSQSCFAGGAPLQNLHLQSCLNSLQSLRLAESRKNDQKGPEHLPRPDVA